MKNFRSVDRFFYKTFILAGLFLLCCYTSFSQCLTSSQFGDQLIHIEKQRPIPDPLKFKKVIALKRKFDRCPLFKDSVYAKILHRLGVLQFKMGSFKEAVNYIHQSISINNSGRNETSRKLTVNSYYSLGWYHCNQRLYEEALGYFDQCISTGKEYNGDTILSHVIDARLKKGNIYYQRGDYEKGIQEMNLGLQKALEIKDRVRSTYLLHERAQAYVGMHRVNEALRDVQKASKFIRKEEYNVLAYNYKIRAIISEADSNYAKAIYFHKKVIDSRLRIKDTSSLAGDYSDAGNTYLHWKKYREARVNYIKSLELAQKSGAHVTAAIARNNLANVSYKEGNYSVALSEFQNSLLRILPSFKDVNPLANPSLLQCNLISDKSVLSLFLRNKVNCLLYLYNQTANQQYLLAAIKTAEITDAVITYVRHEQIGEQSKLFWRDETRGFFADAIEACYQAKNTERAFNFMEKSRAVLLNDKLNELGASALLSPAEAAEEQQLQINVLTSQQQLSRLTKINPAFKKEQIKHIQAKDNLDNYIKKLQVRHPAYYQYKYADDVPSLTALKKYLAKHKQNFVHYFISDTIIYMLAVTPDTSRFVKIYKPRFNQQLAEFSMICSNEQKLKKSNNPFAALSNSIYKTLFKPLDLPPGRVIICYDNFPIPFEALTTDASGKNFLIYKYIFSYVYSARSIFKKFKNPAGKGNFLGLAPVTYAGYLHLPSLSKAGSSLDKSSSYFIRPKLLTNQEANRKNLLNLLPKYTIVTILSHASADSTDKEPFFFMADSTIQLSELQLFKNPSTELVLLSACQTNVGKMATGEGIFSLARGFASAGIPSVTATLWVANEGAMYNITESFLYNISTGMPKDIALQQAKLAYMKDGNDQQLLPFYWANLILAGNSEPVKLSKNLYPIYWIFGSVLLTAFLAATIFYLKKRK